MTRVHRIRLGPPWEVVPLPDGRVRHVRRFGRPRTLDANERLWLATERIPGAAVYTLNGRPLGERPAGGGWVFDITPLVQPRNELVIEVASAEPLGSVGLEVWTDEEAAP